MGQYALIADIEQMFYQLKVRENDQDALMFLWRTTKFENPVDYVMTVFTLCRQLRCKKLCEESVKQF